MTLLTLSNGMSSLEFAPDDLAAVQRAISNLFGKTTNHMHATYSLIAFGNETFLFEQEWDEPCLIAETQAGGRMLMLVDRQLF